MQTVLRIALEIYGPKHMDVAQAHGQIGHALRSLGQFDRAIEHFSNSIAMFEELLGPESEHVATPLNQMSVCRSHLGQFKEAIEGYRRVLAIRRKTLGNKHEGVATALSNLANSLAMSGDLVGAETAYREALQITKGVFGAEHHAHAQIEINLGTLLCALAGHAAEALALHEHALRVRKATFGPTSCHVVSALSHVMSSSMSARAFERAEAAAMELLAMEPSDPDVVANALAILDHASRRSCEGMTFDFGFVKGTKNS